MPETVMLPMVTAGKDEREVEVYCMKYVKYLVQGKGQRVVFSSLMLACVLGSWLLISNHALAKPIANRPNQATLVILDAKIWRGADGPAANSLAIVNNRIAALGDEPTIRKWIGPDTKVIDAKRRRLVPGMTDSHTHVIGGGLQLALLNLREASSREQFIAAVSEKAKATNPGVWMLGGRWSVESWSTPESPTRYWLDPVTGDIPVLLSRMDGHSALVNTVALRIAGIDENGPPDPAGGEIERDPQTHQPTGILKESAMELVRQHIPPTSPEDSYQALLRAVKHANAHGITSVHDMSNLGDAAAFERAYSQGKLALRITSYLQVDDVFKHLDFATSSDPHHPFIRIVGFKKYMDGSLGSRNAYMHEPFADSTRDTPYPNGQLTAFAADEQRFRRTVETVYKKGLQLAVHAIGDEANHLLLDEYERVAGRRGYGRVRHRIEHAQHLQVSDIARFAQLGVVASMQPLHKADDGRYAEKAIGKERLAGSYAFRQLLDSGALLCFGSDWPVVSLNPFLGIDSAVNSRTLEGKVWLPSHALTVEEALRAYTVTPQIVVGRQKELGTIEMGKLADLVILDRDILTIKPMNISDIKVAYTIVAGKVVFELVVPEKHP